MVDLRVCKEGDVLISKHGMHLTYVRSLLERGYYDHEVMYPDGSLGTRIHDGHVFRHNRMDTDHDIVEIIAS